MLRQTAIFCVLGLAAQAARVDDADLALDESEDGDLVGDTHIASGGHALESAEVHRARRVAEYQGTKLQGRFTLKYLLRRETPWIAPFPNLHGFKDASHLGQGGFGDTWAAFDESLKKDVAVKIFHDSTKYISLKGASEPVYDALQEAAQECKKITELVEGAPSRPEPERGWVKYLCPCLGNHVAESADSGEPAFVVYEMCGKTIDDAIIVPGYEMDPGSFGAEHARLVRGVMKGLIRGIAYLNAFNPPYIHHDLKPENVCVNKDNDARLIDFDALIKADPDETPDSVVSSPPYQAPETVGATIAWTGHPWGFDMYAAGLIWVQMLCPRLEYDLWWNEERGPFVWDSKGTITSTCPNLAKVPGMDEDLTLIADMVDHEYMKRPDPKTVLAKLETLLGSH